MELHWPRQHNDGGWFLLAPSLSSAWKWPVSFRQGSPEATGTNAKIGLEEAPGRRPRMWLQRSVIEHQQQRCIIKIPTHSLESLWDECRCYLSWPHPFPSPPAHHMQHQQLFSSWVTGKSWGKGSKVQGRAAWISGCPNPLSLFSPNNPGLLSKIFLNPILNLTLLTG